MLKEEHIENFSGVQLNLQKCIPSLRKGYWEKLDFSVGGDAPKNFISIYEYQKGSKVRRSNPSTWFRYIAKVGHKWYPLESINEYLFNQIGETLDLNMASSKLIFAGNQLRFLSKYFLEKNESLVHGAEIFSGYVSDEQWAENIEEKGLARKFFTFQFVESAVKKMFPLDAELILVNFVQMLVFDAITGNNDRHFYNWGIVKHIENKKKPIFAPIYDSARGLLWNSPESKLQDWLGHPKLLDDKIAKYCEGSKPKIGWEGLDDLNHFDLINSIYSSDVRYKETCEHLITKRPLQEILNLLKNQFSKYYSNERITLMEKCLIYRFKRLISIINNNKGGKNV
jgi:hypothetical protein